MPASHNIKNFLPVQCYELIWSNFLSNISTNLNQDSTSAAETHPPWMQIARVFTTVLSTNVVNTLGNTFWQQCEPLLTWKENVIWKISKLIININTLCTATKDNRINNSVTDITKRIYSDNRTTFDIIYYHFSCFLIVPFQKFETAPSINW